jgi:uncharacterized membrane protein YjjB (DUF3815 family)
MSRDNEGPITPHQIEDKFRELQGEVDTTAEATKSTAIAIGAALAVGIVVVAFVIGRRRGRKRTTVVEIRRV